MTISSTLKNLVAVVGILIAVSSSQATVVNFTTPDGASVSDGPVSVSALFTTGPGTITIDLTNLTPGIKSAGQGLNGVSFTLSTGQTFGTLTSSSAIERTISKGGSFTDLALPVDTGWSVFSTDTGLNLTIMNVKPTWPAHMLIGPPSVGNVYSSANGSIAGNGPHNPFLAGTAEFVLSVPGVTSVTDITSATFSFGTSAGSQLQAIVSSGETTQVVPEPAVAALLGIGLTGLAVRRYRRRSSS